MFFHYPLINYPLKKAQVKPEPFIIHLKIIHLITASASPFLSSQSLCHFYQSLL